MIDPSDPNFEIGQMFGEIQTSLIQINENYKKQNGRVDNIAVSVEKVADRISALPCKEQSQKVDEIVR